MKYPNHKRENGFTTDVVTQPGVYFVGKSEVNGEELFRFLEGHGIKWETDSDAGAEVLVEAGGRLCYYSYAKPRPGGNQAYIERIIQQRHGCYDGATEVLTADGWKCWPDLAEKDLFATLNVAGEIEYQRAQGFVTEQYEGPMYAVRGRGVDLLVTPNHRMFVCPTTTRAGRKRLDYDFVRADELGYSAHAYTKVGTWKGGRSVPGTIAALLGFTIGDGYTRDGGAVDFHLRRQRKILWLSRTSSAAGWDLKVRSEEKFTLRVPAEWRETFAAVYGPGGDKCIPPDILSGWNAEALMQLMEGLLTADGHRWRTGDSFDTTSDTLAGQFQQLCLHVGLAANVNYRLEDRAGSYGDKPLTRLSIITKEKKPEVNRWEGSVGETSWIKEWAGLVYCVQVPNGTLYVRRNGKPVWCGNSVLEHNLFTWILTGISRDTTHELVRYRHMSFSQLSGRYVDSSELGFVVPEVVRKRQALYVRWLEAVELCRRVYREIDGALFEEFTRDHVNTLYQPDALIPFPPEGFKLDPETKRNLQKRSREAARSVLPGACETKIEVSANARALRHFFEERCNKHAAWEIRRMACQMFRQAEGEAPHLFQGYTFDILPDETFHINAPNPKV